MSGFTLPCLRPFPNTVFVCVNIQTNIGSLCGNVFIYLLQMQFSSMFSSFAIFKASFLRWPPSMRISSRSSTPLPIETSQPHGAREASSHTSTIRGCKGWNRAQGSGLVSCLLSRPHHQFRRRPSLGFR